MEFSMTTDAYDLNKPIDERLEHFSSAGFTYIHWSEHWTSNMFYTEAYAGHVAQMAERCGIRIQNVHGVSRIDRDRPFTAHQWHELNANRIRFISWLGGDSIVVHLPLAHCDHLFDSERDQSEKLIELLLPEAQRFGVRLAIENIEARHCVRLFDHLFRIYPPEDLGFCFDSGHANVTGEMDILERYLDRLIMTHLHDNHGRADEHLLPGQGAINWKPIIQTLKKRPDLPCLNLEVVWPGTVPKEKWCGEAYHSIAQLWAENE